MATSSKREKEGCSSSHRRKNACRLERRRKQKNPTINRIITRIMRVHSQSFPDDVVRKRSSSACQKCDTMLLI